MSDQNRYKNPQGTWIPDVSTPDPSAQDAGEDFDFVDQTRPQTFKSILKKPLTIAATLLTIGVIGVIVWLEGGKVYVELPPPEVTYELLPNKGLTEGVPIAVKINDVSIFKISDPVAGGGGALRAKEIVTNVEGAVQDLLDQPGRNITIDESGEMPAIIQSLPDGTGKRLIVQLTEGDVTVSEQNDAKWLARTWAERLTDSLKVFVFAEAPQFTDGSEFGAALTTLFLESKGERGAISGASIGDAFEGLSEEQRFALADFPIPVREEEGEGQIIEAAIQ